MRSIGGLATSRARRFARPADVSQSRFDGAGNDDAGAMPASEER